MRTVPLVDPTFGISFQALAVMHALQTYNFEVDSLANASTTPWYNGRECGLCISLSRQDEERETSGFAKYKQLNITFGEERRSDSIFVDAWVTPPTYINPPTVADFTDEAYKNRRSFAPLDVKSAAEHIIAKVKEFLKIDNKE